MRAILEDDQSIIRKVGVVVDVVDVVDVVGKVGGFEWRSEVLDANTKILSLIFSILFSRKRSKVKAQSSKLTFTSLHFNFHSLTSNPRLGPH